MLENRDMSQYLVLDLKAQKENKKCYEKNLFHRRHGDRTFFLSKTGSPLS